MPYFCVEHADEGRELVLPVLAPAGGQCRRPAGRCRVTDSRTATDAGFESPLPVSDYVLLCAGDGAWAGL